MDNPDLIRFKALLQVIYSSINKLDDQLAKLNRFTMHPKAMAHFVDARNLLRKANNEVSDGEDAITGL